MKCPMQTAFVKKLDELIEMYADAHRDHFSIDEQDSKFKKFSEHKRQFVNLWCPTCKEYEPYQ